MRVSPSLMAIDGKESTDLGTLLQVMNLVPNALVSTSKDPIDPSFNASNLRMATGSKLEGNTLHIRASQLAWTTHLLTKVADMLHGISPSIIYGERWLRKPVREPSLIIPPNKMGHINLL